MHVPLTPLRCLLRALDLYPGKIGVVEGETRTTYAQFADRCRRIAAGLVANGVAPDDRIGVLSFNSSALLESYYAIPLADAIVMPLNVRLHPTELEVILRHAQPTVLLYENDFSAIVEQLRHAVPDCLFIAINDSTTDLTLASLLQHAPIPMPDLMAIDETAITELFYTSGSTGAPKGVMLSHRTLYLHALSLAASLDHDDGHVLLHTIPLFHANGWGFPQFGTMCGFKHVMLRRFDPPTIFRLIEEERVSYVILVPTMAAALLSCPTRTQHDLSSLKYVILGGAASSPELIAQLEAFLPHTSITVGYGLTETSPVVSTARPKGTNHFADDNQRLRFSASAGWPVIGTDVRVVDSQGCDVPQDNTTVGELVVRGDQVMDGYYRSPKLTREALIEGWLHTGDMAVWSPEKFFRIVDRKKDIIISGGENIASIEVEHALLTHHGVLECVVVAAPDPRWGEIPVAIVVVAANSAITEEQLLETARKHLGKFKLPRRFVIQTEPLPKGGTGKILKGQLRAQFWTTNHSHEKVLTK
ncbi:long-chain-fatty-acid--CoA ligase [Granulicella sp. L46]|uniref:long-chain-fatty-acid--CoA ligase n=1 Tax=Granulicella sp. L46 TaxID=1641865 RepID=UPI00131DE102|nr:long-chain-fatty-acid--CoA ligase [Granulicella sp. L46]